MFFETLFYLVLAGLPSFVIFTCLLRNFYPKMQQGVHPQLHGITMGMVVGPVIVVHIIVTTLIWELVPIFPGAGGAYAWQAMFEPLPANYPGWFIPLALGIHFILPFLYWNVWLASHTAEKRSS